MHLKFTSSLKKIKQTGARLMRRSFIRLCLYTIDFVEIRFHYILICEVAAFSALMVI